MLPSAARNFKMITMIVSAQVRLQIYNSADARTFVRDVRAYGVCRLAQDCGLSRGSVSQFINGKGTLSQKMSDQLLAFVRAWKKINLKRYAKPGLKRITRRK